MKPWGFVQIKRNPLNEGGSASGYDADASRDP